MMLTLHTVTVFTKTGKFHTQWLFLLYGPIPLFAQGSHKLGATYLLQEETLSPKSAA